MIEYPKTENLFARDMGTKKLTMEYRCPEFEAVKYWHITEKIDGMNMRVGLRADGTRFVAGRTDAAQIPKALMAYIDTKLSEEKLKERLVLPEVAGGPGDYILFGEGFGPGIQKGGHYQSFVSFILFDVLVGHRWASQDVVSRVAEALEIERVPVLNPRTMLSDVLLAFPQLTSSRVGPGTGGSEGVIGRSVPLMYNEYGNRIMWKLKHRDFDYGT